MQLYCNIRKYEVKTPQYVCIATTDKRKAQYEDTVYKTGLLGTFISSVVEGLRHLSDDQNIPLQVAIDKKFGRKSAK